MTIYLYIKTHRVTGLKYFGMTRKNDPFKYKGSGKKWKRHISKYGYDVTTDIVGMFENIEEASDFALRFSKENNIVESNEWANLIPEDVIGVPPPMAGEKNYFFGKRFVGEKNPNYGKPLSEAQKEKLRQSHLGKKVSEETRLKLSEHNKGEKNYFYGKKLTHWKGRHHSEETKEKIKQANLGRKPSEEAIRKTRERNLGENNYFSKNKFLGEKHHFFGKHHSEETKEKLRKTRSKKWLITFPDGNEKIIINLTKFCLENKLHVGHLGCEGKYKGWKCKKLEE